MTKTGWHTIRLLWARDGRTGTVTRQRKGQRAIAKQAKALRDRCKAYGKTVVALTTTRNPGGARQ